jgi:transforming growth factor-beta-induced protein
MKKSLHLSKLRNTALVGLFFASFLSNAQTNVYDDIIAASADHTSLAAAISTAGLEPALQDASATLTVFAPDNDAFDDLALELGTDIPGLLALPNLGDILLYHVLGVSADAASITNGDVVTPLDPSNTIKLTKTSAGAVYANQAMVEAADLTADNGFVHSIDAVILAKETVADVAIDNGFSTLVTAVATAELLPALTDPFAELTVFAPDNAAFDALAVALNTDLNGILALPNLQDVLLYHVVGATVLSTDLVSGPVTMLSGSDVQVDLTNGVMINTATVTLADVTADNGVVHVIDEVLLENTANLQSEELDVVDIYPNPATEYIVVSTPKTEALTISIFSTDGKMVHSQNVMSNDTLVNIEELNSGQYIIKVECKNSTIIKNLLIASSK